MTAQTMRIRVRFYKDVCAEDKPESFGGEGDWFWEVQKQAPVVNGNGWCTHAGGWTATPGTAYDEAMNFMPRGVNMIPTCIEDGGYLM